MLQDCIDILNIREEDTGDSWRAEIYGPMTEEAGQYVERIKEGWLSE